MKHRPLEQKDLELYTDDINFEAIVGLVRKANKTPEEVEKTKKIYYNVFQHIFVLI